MDVQPGARDTREIGSHLGKTTDTEQTPVVMVVKASFRIKPLSTPHGVAVASSPRISDGSYPPGLPTSGALLPGLSSSCPYFPLSESHAQTRSQSEVQAKPPELVPSHTCCTLQYPGHQPNQKPPGRKVHPGHNLRSGQSCRCWTTGTHGACCKVEGLLLCSFMERTYHDQQGADSHSYRQTQFESEL